MTDTEPTDRYVMVKHVPATVHASFKGIVARRGMTISKVLEHFIREFADGKYKEPKKPVNKAGPPKLKPRKDLRKGREKRIMIRDLPRALVDAFKAACYAADKTMNGALIQFIRDYVREYEGRADPVHYRDMPIAQQDSDL